jgi:hypothetical protein
MTEEEAKECISNVCEQHTNLTAFGFGGKGEIRPHAMKLCIEWILIHDGLERRKTVNEKISSYTYKHKVERYFNEYISNGEFICAALYLKYKMKIRGPNAWFNIKTLKEK